MGKIGPKGRPAWTQRFARDSAGASRPHRRARPRIGPREHGPDLSTKKCLEPCQYRQLAVLAIIAQRSDVIDDEPQAEPVTKALGHRRLDTGEPVVGDLGKV